MKRRPIIRLIILALFILITTYYYSLQINEDTELYNSIQSRVEQALQQSENITVDLNERTTFKWDTLYIIKPFPYVKEFCKKHNIKYKLIQYRHSDDNCILLFVLDKKIVTYIQYPRGYGDFVQPSIKEKYSAKDTVFKFYRDENGEINVEH